ncbi:hypothetical protein GCM10027175_06340 [Hymenobacter latericoloratus]
MALLCRLIVFLLAPLASQAQTTSTIVAFDFNSGTSYETLAPVTAPGVAAAASSTESFVTFGGVAAGANAFSPATAGVALGMSNSSGTNSRFFQFTLAGANLSSYSAYKLYFQSFRPSTGAPTITVTYSTDGGTNFTAATSVSNPAVSTFAEHVVDLSGVTALNNKPSVILRLLASGASGSGPLRIDNFQVQATSALNPTPVLTAVSPTSIAAGSNGFVLTVTGSGFTSGSVVRFNGADRPTTFVSATQLTATIPASDVVQAGTYPVTVANPAPGGGSSGSVGFVVTPVVRWDGGARTNSWFDALNWDTDAVPTTTDDVLLDHATVAGRYTVLLDAGGAVAPATTPTAEVRSLTINPGAGDSILVEISVLNTATTPLRLNRTGATETALAIYNKGVLTNSSDRGTIDIPNDNPNFYLYNGGTYRHYTEQGHAGLVENLAAVPGTENGTWEFRRKTAGSTTLSFSGRSYPNVVFRKLNTITNASYAASGSSPITIRGSLIVGPGAVFTASASNELRVAADIVVQGSFRFQPQVAGTTTARLVLNGTRPQRISGAAWGSPATAATFLGNDVPLQLNNTSPEGVTLATPVTVNNVLQLTAGRLNTDATNVLTLVNQPTGGSDNSFVNGPVARPASGAATLTFPLGRLDAQGPAYRPLTLTISSLGRATTFTATQTEGGFATKDLTGDLRRLNATRYFTVTPTPALTSADGFSGTITLSFGPDDQVADPSASTLVVAKHDGNGWVNIGRSASSGSASTGSFVAGTLTSGPFTSFSQFTLASTSAAATPNPLPVTLLHFRAEGKPEGVRLSWATAAELNNARFEIQRSSNGRNFTAVASLPGQGTSTTSRTYSWLDTAPPVGTVYYRLRQVDADGSSQWLGVAVVQGRAIATFYPNPVQDQLSIQAASGLRYRVLNPVGQVVLSGQTLEGGTRLDVRLLRPGVYYLRLEGHGNAEGFSFYKQ